LKAVIPGGSSVYIMRADQIIGKDVRMDYEGLVAAVRWSARAASS
jgi:NADH:ubiquinone oxidoreductase subunit F (NADH-binding)